MNFVSNSSMMPFFWRRDIKGARSVKEGFLAGQRTFISGHNGWPCCLGVSSLYSLLYKQKVFLSLWKQTVGLKLIGQRAQHFSCKTQTFGRFFSSYNTKTGCLYQWRTGSWVTSYNVLDIVNQLEKLKMITSYFVIKKFLKFLK